MTLNTFIIIPNAYLIDSKTVLDHVNRDIVNIENVNILLLSTAEVGLFI